MEHPFRPIVGQWLAKIRIALQHKKTRFQDHANEMMQFFQGPYDFLYGRKLVPGDPALFADGILPAPSFRITINKVAELVQLFGPALYHRNPTRRVTPRQSPLLPPSLWDLLAPPPPAPSPGGKYDPLMALQAQMQFQAYQQQVLSIQQATEQRLLLDQARAQLLETYLNATPHSLDLKTEFRNAIDEALIKGMGLMMVEPYEPPGSGRRMVGSFFQTVDDLVIDPDARSWRDAKWIALRCRHPHWEAEEEYGLARDSLKKAATNETTARQAEIDAAGSEGQGERRRGGSNDQIVYWKVYSKMGLGGRLSGVTREVRNLSDALGTYCYLVVAENVDFPLNVPTGLLEAMPKVGVEGALQLEKEVQHRVEWPTPFWADDAWPVVPVAFHWIPNEVWPMSHLRPAIGELRAINWIWSMLVAKVKTASRDFIAIMKSASDQVKSQIANGADYTIIEIDALHESIDKVVKFLQHPEFNSEIYTVLKGLMELFDRRTGLTELLYGLSANQMRSAEEAAIKGDQVSVRPDDMANKVEDVASLLGRQEAFAARYHLLGQDVTPQLGDEGAFWWDQLLSGTDPDAILQLQYRVEGGSTRKPNRARDQANAQQAVASLFAPLFQYGQLTGDVEPVNALITQWGKANDVEYSSMLLKPPPPPPPPVPAQPTGNAPPESEMITA